MLCYVIYTDPIADVTEGSDRATDCSFSVEDYSMAVILMFLEMGGYIAATILLPNGSLYFLLLRLVSQYSLVVSIKTALVDALKTSSSAASNELSKMEAYLPYTNQSNCQLPLPKIMMHIKYENRKC